MSYHPVHCTKILRAGSFRESVRRPAFRAPQPRQTEESLRVEPILRALRAKCSRSNLALRSMSILLAEIETFGWLRSPSHLGISYPRVA
jgi:hypothetical protein